MDQSPLYDKELADIWSLGCIYSEVAVWVVRGQDGLEEYRKRRQDETKQIHNFKDGGCFHDGQKVLQSVDRVHEEVFDNVRISDHVTKSVVKKMIADMLDEVDIRPNTMQLWKRSQRILRDAEKDLKSTKNTQQETDPFILADQSLELNLDETPGEMPYPVSSLATSSLDTYDSNYSQHRHVVSTWDDYPAAPPEELSETDDPNWNKSSTPHGKARYHNSTISRTPVTGHIRRRSFAEIVSDLNIRILPELPPERDYIEVPDNSRVESNPSKPHIAQKRTTTTIETAPYTKKPATQRVPLLSVRTAERWIHHKKRGQTFSTPGWTELLNMLAGRHHVSCCLRFRPILI
jgi:hypothetical protein